MFTIRILSIAGATMFAASAAHAQSIADGNSSFSHLAANTTGAAIRTGTGGGTGGTFVAGGDASDQIFQHWMWYRVNGVSAREFALSNRTASNPVGNRLDLSYTEPEGLTIRVAYILTDGPDAPASANVGVEVVIVNTSGAPLDVSFFSYLDYDLEGSPTDGATQVGPGRIQVQDQTTSFRGQYLADTNVDAFQVDAYPGLQGAMSDGDIDNLSNSGLPFAPADFSANFQWNMTIPAGGQETVRFAFSLGMDAVLPTSGPTCDGVDFNGDGLFPDVQDITDFIAVFGGAPCPTGSCGDIDFNNDGLFPDITDIDALVSVFGGGACIG